MHKQKTNSLSGQYARSYQYLRVQLLRSHGGSERKAYFFPTKERGGPSFDVADTGIFAARFPTSRRRETDADRSPTRDDAALNKNNKFRKYTQHLM